MKHLPPLATLRALEAVSRLLSFTRASEELNVTQSAVSHQIRHLEELWQVQLFDRHTRRLVATSAGKALAAVARDFFRRLDETLTTVRDTGGHTALRVEMVPTFAIKWLVPRLQSFRDAEPDIDVWISTKITYQLRLDDDALDAVIHLGTGDYPGFDSWPLMREYAFPVCRPRFIEEHGMPESPADLCNYPLLLRHHEIDVPSWEFWFQAAGVPESLYRKAISEGPRFPDSNMALQAAYEGQGIALARSSHVWEDLKQGRFQRLFEIHCPFTRAYYLVARRERAERPAIAAFRSWLIDEARRSQAEYDAAESAVTIDTGVAAGA